MHAYRSKRIIPVLTDDEMSRLKETIESGDVSNRDAAIILLGLSTGIRAIDLINLRLSDIDWNSETISFKQSKTGNLVCIPLTVAVGNAIARYLYEDRPSADNDYLFVRDLAPFGPLSGHSSCYGVFASHRCCQSVHNTGWKRTEESQRSSDVQNREAPEKLSQRVSS